MPMAFVMVALTLLTAAAALPTAAAPSTVFEGRPEIQITESGISRVAEKVDTKKAAGLHCVISEINGKYYWASRKNKELVKVESGPFVTYAAVDGSGFIRLIDPDRKDAAAMMSSTEAKFDYVETSFTGLVALLYYGRFVPQ
jgi:hypothetical protein